MHNINYNIVNNKQNMFVQKIGDGIKNEVLYII